MNETIKILSSDNCPICLYCGYEMEKDWDEYHPYYICYCRHATLERELDEKIRDLKSQYPEEKYSVIERKCLVKK